MKDTIGVIVATFGEFEPWDRLAQRALRSVDRQTRLADVTIRHHGASLHEARNEGARLASTDWLVFLDADDELDDRYLEFMAAGGGDIRQPATLGVVNDKEDSSPVVIPSKPLLDGNYIVVGAMCRSEQFFRVGGFDDWPAYEDWALWIKCWIDGAVIGQVPEAIYRVHVSERSRNQMARGDAVKTYNAIRNRFLPLAQQKGLA